MKLSASILLLSIILLAGFTIKSSSDGMIEEEFITIEFYIC